MQNLGWFTTPCRIWAQINFCWIWIGSFVHSLACPLQKFYFPNSSLESLSVASKTPWCWCIYMQIVNNVLLPCSTWSSPFFFSLCWFISLCNVWVGSLFYAMYELVHYSVQGMCRPIILLQRTDKIETRLDKRSKSCFFFSFLWLASSSSPVSTRAKDTYFSHGESQRLQKHAGPRE